MTEAPTGTKTLLVVEDDPIIREGVAVVLRDAGYNVATAIHGMGYLRRQKPDLIILDMLLPVLDGWKFLERVRRLDLDVPILVMTATPLNPDWAKQSGCCGLIRKPVDAPELVAEVNRCLDN